MPFTTRLSLLIRVKDGDDASWTEFYEKYEELIRLYGKKRGLTKEERDDLVQNVMNELSEKKLVGKYNPNYIPNLVKNYDISRGRFRFFLRGIANNQALKILNKRINYVTLDDPEQQGIEPTVDEWNGIWDEEWMHFAKNKALEILRNRVEPKTYQAFHMIAMQGRSPQEVASFLGMSKEGVYQHKHRCLKILKDTVSTLKEL